MKNSNTSTYIYPRWNKFLGLTIIILGIIIFLYRVFEYNIVDLAGGSFPVAIGLMFIFFAKEKDFDERVVYLKFKALAIAVPSAATITMVINYIKNFKEYSVKTDSFFSMSAFEYLCITLVLAIGLFHYLKYKE